MGLRLLLYDDTCRGQDRRLPLTYSWRAGQALYRGLGRLDAAFGARSWGEGLRWLAEHAPDREISEIQYWGHGRWGHARVGAEVMDARALAAGHPLNGPLRAIRERLAGPEALWWFRTCETFGAAPGQDFARAWTDFLGCSAAGHTFVIGPWQSGLHALAPGQAPDWALDEGLAAGTPQAPERAWMSGPRRPNTIHCLQGTVPAKCWVDMP